MKGQLKQALIDRDAAGVADLKGGAMMRSVRSSRFSHGWSPFLILALVLVGGVIWGLAAALAASPAASPSSSSGKIVLRLGWTQEPDNLNPFIGYAEATYEIWALNYDYLFGMNVNNQAALDLATEFPTQQNGGISPDGKVWTIHIRSDARFCDGVPVTASDVAFTYNYIIKNQMANYLNYVRGIESAKALNPTTVQLTCAHPMALGYMETNSVPILPEHIWKNVSPSAAITSYGDKPPIIGSGPFETVTYIKGSYTKMVRNPYYWGQKPAIDQIYFEMYQNATTMVTDLRAGKIDGAWGIPVAQFKQLQSAKGIKAIAHPFYDWDYLEFNCYDKPSSLGNPVLRDWHFRNAINYAIDKQRLAELAYAGLAAPATTIISPNTWTNPDYHWQPPADQAYTFNIAKANQLLDQAGYPQGGVRLNKGPTDRLAPHDLDRPSGVSDRAEAHSRLAAAARPESQALGGRLRHVPRRHLQLPAWRMGAELRPDRLVVDRLLRRRCDVELPHDRRDRQPRRALLVQCSVRQAGGQTGEYP